MDSVLTINGLGLPLFSARGCRQELVPIPNGHFRKTVNGDLCFIKLSDRQRYKTIIKCKDVNVPAFGNFRIGSIVKIDCIQSIWQNIEAGTQSIELIRDFVDGSVLVINENGQDVPFSLNGKKIELKSQNDSNLFVSFRPSLQMLITHFVAECNEWDLTHEWRLEAEEI